MRARHPGPWLTGIVIFGLGALGLSPVAQAAGLGATSALVGQPSRVGSYDNAAVADVMLSYVNQNGVNVCLGTPYGSAYPGECKQTVNCAIYRASGGTQRPGGGDDYFGSFIAAGGVEVAQANAVKGDVIQWGSGTTGSQHTAVVVENQGGGNFRVVDSNFNRDHIVRDHVMNVNTFFAGYTPRFARMGTPRGGGIADGSLLEMFACGTAAVIAPIGALVDHDERLVVGDGEPGPVTIALRRQLLDVQHGLAEDRLGWLARISTTLSDAGIHL